MIIIMVQNTLVWNLWYGPTQYTSCEYESDFYMECDTIKVYIFLI